MNQIFTPLGLVIVFASIIVGYTAHGGNLHILWQPTEFIIIGGAALGAFLASSTPHLAKETLKVMKKGILYSPIEKKDYLEVLNLLNDIFAKVRKEGPLKLESHIEKPEDSPLFQKYPDFLKKSDALEFLTDSFRTIITTKILYYDLNALFEDEIEAHFEEQHKQGELINEIAESFPGLGIVAAVLGVILTMEKISEPPEVLGHSIGAALVGTFLGVLMCYGIVAPIARKMKMYAEGQKEFLKVIKTIIIYFVSGVNPKVAIEFGRRAIPKSERPTFEELENVFSEMKKLQK